MENRYTVGKRAAYPVYDGCGRNFVPVCMRTNGHKTGNLWQDGMDRKERMQMLSLGTRATKMGGRRL